MEQAIAVAKKSKRHLYFFVSYGPKLPVQKQHRTQESFESVDYLSKQLLNFGIGSIIS